LYHAASFTLRGASVHLYFSGLPIDLWVVILELGISKDHALLSKARDGEEYPFRVSFVMKDYIHYFRDLTCLIGRTIHIVYQYGVRDALGANTFHMDKVFIYEVAHSSRVQKHLDRMHFASVSGADFYREDDRYSTSIKGVGRESFG